MVIDLELGDRLALLAQGLDQLDIGFTIFDRELVLVASNRRFQQLLNFPDALCKAGTRLQDALHYNATQGEYGPGDVTAQVQERLLLAQRFLSHRFERVRPDGTIIEVCGTPLAMGGMVTTYTDVTVPRQREIALRELVVRNVNQGISLINADLQIELCNDKFGELLDLPPHLCQPGTSFVDLAMFNAQRGEYGPGDPAVLVEQRVAIARQGLPHQFERTRPDGRTLEIMGQPTPPWWHGDDVLRHQRT